MLTVPCATTEFETITGATDISGKVKETQKTIETTRRSSIADISESYPSEFSFHSNSYLPPANYSNPSETVDDHQQEPTTLIDQLIQTFDELIIDKLVMGLLTPRKRERFSLNHQHSNNNLTPLSPITNRKSTQSMPTTPVGEDDFVRIMLVSGENWGVGQSSIAKRFVLNQFVEEKDSDFVSKHVSKSYSKEIILRTATQEKNNLTLLEENNNRMKENVTGSVESIYYTTPQMANNNLLTIGQQQQHSNSVGLSSERMSYLYDQQTNASPSTHSLLSNASSSVSNSSESLLFHPRSNVILQIEDYVPSYITDLETTDDRLSNCENYYDEQFYLEFKRNQQDYYYEKDVFLICFDGKNEDFLNYVYNEIETIRNACDEFTEYKIIALVLTKQDLNKEQNQANEEIHATTSTTILSEEKREQMIEKLLEETKLELFRVSAKDNVNIQELFQQMAEKAIAVKEKKSRLKAKLKKKMDTHQHNRQYEQQKHKCLLQ
ncbi:rho small GTPase [Naegleria gruberi]|uniref:Rho small GTPase n=1 Tax=Naegleria gruberi TaxID=5762 RepID=D2V1Z4_NAEGR|nr:rho small GTPase [Naegleria gruberi]EFC49246.1 rho small GTPase [Naegleria gruberi]|eukprot:XP_002681990.1 rho small GTPase [Naegleria gruberi strain NEG-M]